MSNLPANARAGVATAGSSAAFHASSNAPCSFPARYSATASAYRANP